MDDIRFGLLAGWCGVAALMFVAAGSGFTHTPNPGWFPLLFFCIAGIAGAVAAISLLLWLADRAKMSVPTEKTASSTTEISQT